MKLRHVLSWKGLFYDLLLPTLRRLGPSRGDAVLGALGRLALLRPAKRREYESALMRARTALGAGWDVVAVVPKLAANAARYQARDYPLDDQSDTTALARFDVTGDEALRAALTSGSGAVLVGSHLGAHIAGLHWLHRRGIAHRLLVQRPGHVSRELGRGFARDDGAYPQSGFFLRRDLPAGQCVERLLRARSALRDGMAVYFNGDVPWSGTNTRPGRLLGQPNRFLSVWADLAALTRAPVFLIFCTHAPHGRYRLTIESLGVLTETEAAVGRYLARLETEIAAHPEDALAHLLWPCYGPPAANPAPARLPSRRAARAFDPQLA